MSAKKSAVEEIRVFIGMGSNLGNSKETLLAAWQELCSYPDIECVRLSRPYVSAPVDMKSQHWFTNAVGELRTTLGPRQLLRRLLEVENSLGRVRREGVFGYQDREIDLDLLYYGDTRMDEPELVLPHPHLQNRRFVLEPMAEIAREFLDCKQNRTVAELTARLMERIAEGNEDKQEISPSTWPEQ
ncbi:2-amino-4-hydroxy-6-hydroxymethyldihydropteridine diphosphokinase [Desulfosediminicola sp.]|uniref:2-amino-4-hydroxy-6- hydroxymethyldihydropteridine diphosphokinase n=1 Tax=Desulfosediminicola sp. TaxID=2886825 RepID=UPI003AF23F56